MEKSVRWQSKCKVPGYITVNKTAAKLNLVKPSLVSLESISYTDDISPQKEVEASPEPELDPALPAVEVPWHQLSPSQLRARAWKGVDLATRPDIWRVLLGYAVSQPHQREKVLLRKRAEYKRLTEIYYDDQGTQRTLEENAIWRQIHIDIPRTNPDIDLYQDAHVQLFYQRVLYLWAIKHPATGYVQGMNDLLTPFFITFLLDTMGSHYRFEEWDLTLLADPALTIDIEADCYWCFDKLMANIHDHYTVDQRGLLNLIDRLDMLMQRSDPRFYAFLKENDLGFVQFAFRWMNCLLIRELPISLIIRMWDTYLAEEDGFNTFHIFVCYALLRRFKDDLLGKAFPENLLFLQQLPTRSWDESDIDLLLSDAFQLKNQYITVI